MMALRKNVILRRPRSGRLEGRSMLTQRAGSLCKATAFDGNTSIFTARVVVMAALVAAIAGCANAPSAEPPAAPPSTPYQCILPAEQRMLVAELFFGRNIRG